MFQSESDSTKTKQSKYYDSWAQAAFLAWELWANSISRKILEQIIDSLEHCAQRNVFHRDVKLENILVVPTTLQTTLIDFGCGSFYKDTCFTDFAGTPQYYPPEWFLTRKYNGYRQTIWSCGVLLYSLITGLYPNIVNQTTKISKRK